MMYTKQEIANIFKVTYQTVGLWIRDGKLEAVKINNTVRITEASFQKFLEDAKQEGTNGRG